MSRLSKPIEKDQRDPIIYRTETKPISLGDLSNNCYELFRALDGGLLMVDELSKYRTDEGHNFSQLLMAKLALEYAMNRLDDIIPITDKDGRTFHYVHDTGKYEIDRG